MPKFQLSLRFMTASLLLIVALTLVAATGRVIDAQEFRSNYPEGLRAVRLISVSGPADSDVTAEIEIDAQGNEAGFQTSIHFDPAVLSISGVSGVSSNPDITVGSGSPAGTLLNVNAEYAGSGDIGIVANFNGANTEPSMVVAAGTRRIIRMKFHILANAAQGASDVAFTNNVIARLLFDGNALPIETPTFQDGNITVVPVFPPSLVSISGRVMTQFGSGLRNAKVTLVGPDGVSRTTTTSSFGFYQFDNVESGKTYTMSIASRSSRFNSRLVNVSGNVTDMDCVGVE